MRSKRVILHDSPNRNTRAGTYCGKTAPCPCTTRTPGATQEVLSGLLPVIRQQAMQLQSQIMQEKPAGTHGRPGRNVRCQHPYAGNKYPAITGGLTNPAPGAEDAEPVILIPVGLPCLERGRLYKKSTPRKQPLSASTPSRAPFATPAYSGSAYTTPLSRSLPHTQDKASQTKPKRTLAATFCGYPSDEEDDRL